MGHLLFLSFLVYIQLHQAPKDLYQTHLQRKLFGRLPMLHKEYVQSGRYNAFDLERILRQMYPELGKRQASSYVADFFKTFKEHAELNHGPDPSKKLDF